MKTERIDLARYIREIPDWPKKGILFRDITPLLGDPKAFPQAIESLCKPFRHAGVQYVAAVEARGFIFGAAVAAQLGAGFVPIRKKGKLPWRTESPDLRAGVRDGQHRDAPRCDPGRGEGPDGGRPPRHRRHDVRGLQTDREGRRQIVGIAFVIELADLEGRERLAPYKIHSLISY